MTIILVVLATFLITTLLGYLFHRALHQPWMGSLYRAHKTHHTLYISDDFTSDQYRSAGSDNTMWAFILFAIPIVIGTVVLIALNVVPLFYGLLTLGEMSLIGIGFDRLHDAFHLNHTRWSRLPGYQTLKELHRVHHREDHSNFGVLVFWWDRIFGTFNR